MLAKPLHICLIAGEPSGDALGASLMRALKSDPTVMISGVGGPKMEAEGLQSLFPIDDLAVMGIVEVAPKLKKILSLIERTARFVEMARPDIVVTIDSPDFCFRVQKRVRRIMGADAPKLIHYVAPTVWAWREKRAEKIARFLDGLICLFDFEPAYFEKEGLRSVAVGHPVTESDAAKASGGAFRERHGIGSEERTLGMFFGSRRGELKRHGDVFHDIMATMPQETRFIVPTLPHLQEGIEQVIGDMNGRAVITVDPAEKWDAFAACDAALAVSGTVGLELAVARVPHVIAYRMNALTYEIARRMVKVKYAHLLNIMLDEPVVPEFIQNDCAVPTVSAAIQNLMKDERARQVQMNAFSTFARRIGEGDESPSHKAAAFIRSFRP